MATLYCQIDGNLESPRRPSLSMFMRTFPDRLTLEWKTHPEWGWSPISWTRTPDKKIKREMREQADHSIHLSLAPDYGNSGNSSPLTRAPPTTKDHTLKTMPPPWVAFVRHFVTVMEKVAETVSKPVSHPSTMMDGPPRFAIWFPLSLYNFLSGLLKGINIYFWILGKNTNTQVESY